MQVWFGTTTLRYKEFKKYYLLIREYLLETGCIITDDWIGECGTWIENNPTKRRDIKTIYQKVIAAIDQADISIIEFTVPNFSSSHQINYSLFKRKPTLVMRLQKDNTFADSYIEALDSPFLTIKDYTLKNYKDILDEFIGYSKLEKGFQRYNIVLDRQQKHYLDWASAKYGNSRSELIRKSIDTLIKCDRKYKNSLGIIKNIPL